MGWGFGAIGFGLGFAQLLNHLFCKGFGDLKWVWGLWILGDRCYLIGGSRNCTLKTA